VPTVVNLLVAATAGLRVVVFVVAVIVGLVALVDWAVRTRRLNPFGAVARFMRRTVDPLLLPVERRVIRAGGKPSTAAFWTLAAVVVGGLVLLMVLQFLTGQVVMAGNAITNGPTGVLILVVHWTFALLQFALLFRVISSWIAVSPYSRWVRWSYVLTEWFLRPLRRVIPTVGMFDITPIIAYFGLILLERLVLGAL
jgi:YggT family protein